MTDLGEVDAPSAGKLQHQLGGGGEPHHVHPQIHFGLKIAEFRGVVLRPNTMEMSYATADSELSVNFAQRAQKNPSMVTGMSHLGSRRGVGGVER